MNEAHHEIEEALDRREEVLLDSEPALSQALDVTLPGIYSPTGGLHPTVTGTCRSPRASSLSIRSYTVFGHAVRTRMRTGFFPFVEQGFEIDMECQVCHGSGCRRCHEVGWLEVMPGGSPHPNVLRAGGLDPEEWMGFYVNVGLDRLVMMRYGIDDVRVTDRQAE